MNRLLSALVDWALNNRIMTLIFGAALALAGTLAMLNLPVDAFPDVSAPQVKIILKVPGLSPEEMEQRVTVPVETELLGLPKQVMLRSTSKYGLSDITLDFADGTDIYWARQQVSERLAGAMPNLPAGIEGGLAPITTPLGEMFMFTLDGDMPLAERRAVLDWVIRPALRTVPGVADVNALGGRVSTFEVAPDPIRMAARGVTLDALRMTLEANNRNDGAGRMQAGEEALLVRVLGRLTSLEDIAALRVPTANGNAVGGDTLRLDQVAEVRMGNITRQGGVVADGKGETVEGLVLGLRGEDSRQTIAGVRARLAELEPSLPKGVSIHVFYDRSELTGEAIASVAKALLEAVVIVLVLLLLFLGELRASLVVALVLPMAALITFMAMRQMGMTANLMSLGGLAIALGMLVDAAVVVVENIVGRLAAHDGRRLLDVVREATHEMAAPVATGMLIIATVFLPLLTLQGLEGKLFSPVAVTIILALAAALLLSLTLIPVVATYVLESEVSIQKRREREQNVGANSFAHCSGDCANKFAPTSGTHGESWLVRQLHRAHTPALRWSLAHPRILMTTVLIMVAAAVWALGQAGKTFMPTMDEGAIIVQLETPPSIDLDASLALDLRVQQALLAEVPEITSIIARAGSDELGLDPMGLNQTDSFLVLKPRAEWQVADKEALIDRIRGVLDASFPGVNYAFTQPIEMRVSEMIIGVRGDVAVRLFGPDLQVLNEKAAAIAKVLENTSGAEDVFTTQAEGVRYLDVTLERAALTRLGLSVDEIASLLRVQFDGVQVGEIQQDARRIPLVLKAETGQSLDNVAALPLLLQGGAQITLGQVAQVSHRDGPVLIAHEQGARNVVILSNVRGRDLAGFVAEAQARVAKDVPLDAGYRLTWGGEFQNQARAMQRLGVVVPLSIVVIFGVLIATFGAWRPALLVLANVPLALIGGVLALFMAGEYLSVPASVGFIALLGIAVLNGVVLVSHFLHLRHSGMAMAEAVVEGTQRRLRPVMMTASIAALGLLPLWFATGPGSEIQRPLAVVVMGGLVSSTLLTLILLPVLFARFGEARVKSS